VSCEPPRSVAKLEQPRNHVGALACFVSRRAVERRVPATWLIDARKYAISLAREAARSLAKPRQPRFESSRALA
jgi:hypothetical protein